MVKKEDINDVLIQLTGGIRKRFIIYKHGKCEYSINSHGILGQSILIHDDTDLLFFRVIYEVRKPGLFTYREVIKEPTVSKFMISTGTFTPSILKNIHKEIPISATITNIQFITGLKVYKNPGTSRHEVNIGTHKLYFGTLENCYQWVNITDKKLIIEEINGNTGVPYKTNNIPIKLARNECEFFNTNKPIGETISYKTN